MLATESFVNNGKQGRDFLTSQQHGPYTPQAHLRRSLPSMSESRKASLKHGSSTEGTPSPELDIHRSSQMQQQNTDRILVSFNGAHTPALSDYSLSFAGGDKNAASSTIESREASRSGGRPKRTLETLKEFGTAKRAKLSSANSPWTFRRSDD